MILKLKNYFFKKASNCYLWIGLALIVGCIVSLFRAQLLLQQPSFTDSVGISSQVTLPLLRELPPEDEFVVSGTIYYKRWLNCSIAHIIPDDQLLAIRVNGRDVSLAGIDPAALCDYSNGFHYNFKEYLRDGANRIEFRIKNTAGPAGLDWQPSYHDWRMLTGCLLVALLTIGLVYYLVLDTAVNPVFALIITGGFLVRLFYFLVTPFGMRSHDVGGHMQYIEYLLNNHALPAIHDGWQTYQPPLYYLVAAGVYKLLQLAGITESAQVWRGIQFLSLALYMGFLGVTWGIIKIVIRKLPVSGKLGADTFETCMEESAAALAGLNPNYGDSKLPTAFSRMSGDPRLAIGYLVFALITFWPSGIIHSLRIGNDVLFYLFYALGLVYLIKWQADDTRRSLYSSFSFITLAFITKANALVLYLVFGVVYLIKFCATAVKHKYLWQTVCLLAIFTLGFGITFGRMVEAKFKGSNDNFLVANASGLQGVAVGNGLKNYLSFDLQSFVTEPYVNPFEDKGGRQSFWNYLFKTGLVGEFWFNNPFHRVLTMVLSILFLLMFVYMIVSLVIFRSYLKGQLVLVLNAVFLLLSAIAFRIAIPAACSNDFRYILPFLISFAWFFGWGTWCFRQHKRYWLAKAGYGLAMFFIVTSIVFFTALLVCTV